LITSCGGSASIKDVIEENIDEASERNRKGKKLLDDLNPTVRPKDSYVGCRWLGSFLERRSIYVGQFDHSCTALMVFFLELK
jgi:hypothetical protein